jgi:hypothetical protein
MNEVLNNMTEKLDKLYNIFRNLLLKIPEEQLNSLIIWILICSRCSLLQLSITMLAKEAFCPQFERLCGIEAIMQDV